MDILTVDFLWSFWGLGAVVLSVGAIVYWETTSRLPDSIPWVGLRDEVFSKPRAWFREFTAGFQTLNDGYFTVGEIGFVEADWWSMIADARSTGQHNTKGKSFVLLDTAYRPQVIVPKEQMRWLTGQPDDVLSQRAVINAKFGVKYLSPPIKQQLNHDIALAVRRDVTRNLGKTQASVFRAMRERVDSIMGMDEISWRAVNLVDVLRPSIASATNCIFFGDALRQNENFVNPMDSYAMLLGLGGVVIGQMVPFFLAPILGPMAAFFFRQYRKRFLKYLVPVVQERMDSLRGNKTNPTASYATPQDLIQYGVVNATGSTASEIADGILSLSLASDHATGMVILQVFLDLLSSPSERGYFEVIHDEAAAVFTSEEAWGNLASLHKLTHIDSALRESMRHNPLFGRGAMQEVVHKNGVTLPDGNHLPRGTWLGVSLAGITMDERYYPDPHTYDPLRFSRARAELASKGEDPNSVSSKAVGEKPNGAYLATTEETFATFGFGRHACPGRWFASHLMKLTLAYIALNYEIQPIADRPPNMIIADVIVAPQNIKLKMRRRKAAY